MSTWRNPSISFDDSVHFRNQPTTRSCRYRAAGEENYKTTSAAGGASGASGVKVAGPLTSLPERVLPTVTECTVFRCPRSARERYATTLDCMKQSAHRHDSRQKCTKWNTAKGGLWRMQTCLARLHVRTSVLFLFFAFVFWDDGFHQSQDLGPRNRPFPDSELFVVVPAHAIPCQTIKNTKPHLGDLITAGCDQHASTHDTWRNHRVSRPQTCLGSVVTAQKYSYDRQILLSEAAAHRMARWQHITANSACGCKHHRLTHSVIHVIHKPVSNSSHSLLVLAAVRVIAWQQDAKWDSVRFH